MLLTEKVLAYQAGHWTWTDLWKDLFLAIDSFLSTRSIDLEISGQIINQLTPRLPAMVIKFKYTGKSFEAFLFTAVRYQLKTVYSQRSQERIREASWQSYQANDVDLSYKDPKLKSQSMDSKICSDHDFQNMKYHRAEFQSLSAENRRLVIVAMKNCAALEDKLCVIVAQRLGCNLTWFMNCRDELRELSRNRLDTYRQLRERERSACFAVQCLAEGNSEAQRKRDRLKAIRRCLQNMNPYPRHEDIARVLGIPKGTVDSSLFYVRKQLTACQKSAEAS